MQTQTASKCPATSAAVPGFAWVHGTAGHGAGAQHAAGEGEADRQGATPAGTISLVATEITTKTRIKAIRISTKSALRSPTSSGECGREEGYLSRQTAVGDPGADGPQDTSHKLRPHVHGYVLVDYGRRRTYHARLMIG